MVVSRFRVILCLIVCLIGILISLPNTVGDVSVLPSFLPNKKVNLGLDLRGGSQLTLVADIKAAIKTNLETVVDSLRDRLREKKIKYRSIRFAGDKIILRLSEKSDYSALEGALKKFYGEKLTWTKEKDSEYGKVVLSFSKQFISTFSVSVLERCIETLKKRVDSMGTVEANVIRQGDDEILIQVPGLKDPAQLKAIVNKVAKLTFHRVVEPSNRSLKIPLIGNSYDGETIGYINIEKRPIVTGDQLLNAKESFQQQETAGGQQRVVVAFEFDTDGARRISKLTRENIGRPFAIVLDGKAISAPRIQSHIPNGAGIIQGNFTLKEAQSLALLMRSGALPTDLKIIEEKTIGADLGEDSIKAGQNATILSIILVALFMLLIYSKLGVIADLALAFNIILLMACLTTFGATLTLPGIAGIALTVGMAVDANVLIFERIREEIKAGIEMSKAVSLGFDKAIATIVDSNLTTLIGALMLFAFGSDAIKGFAVTLSIGILTSMFTAITLTRTLIELWYKMSRSKLKVN